MVGEGEGEGEGEVGAEGEGYSGTPEPSGLENSYSDVERWPRRSVRDRPDGDRLRPNLRDRARAAAPPAPAAAPPGAGAETGRLEWPLPQSASTGVDEATPE